MFDLKDLMSRVNLPQDITRRGFLQVATVTAAFAAMNQARAQTGAQPYIILETPKGLIVGDPSLCVDCQRCEMACTEFNDGKNDPVLARIRIGRNIWYGPGNPGARPLQGVWGDSTVYQDTCRQCAHPVPCANACPQGAIHVDRLRTLPESLSVGHDELRPRKTESQQVLPLRRRTEMRESLPGCRSDLYALERSFRRTGQTSDPRLSA